MAKAKRKSTARPVGRPTTYKPAYCQRVVEMGKEGKSFAQMASAFEVTRQTIDNWGMEHGEFLEALTRARIEAQTWWEDVGQAALGADKFQSSVWRTSMQARFRDDYTERRDMNHSGSVSVVISKDDAEL